MGHFFAVLACHLLVLDEFDQLLSLALSTLSLSSAAVDKSLQHQINSSENRKTFGNVENRTRAAG